MRCADARDTSAEETAVFLTQLVLQTAVNMVHSALYSVVNVLMTVCTVDMTVVRYIV